MFFGNYHKVKCVDGKYQYIKKSGDFYGDNDLQVIWGYMQVGKIIKEAEEQKNILGILIHPKNESMEKTMSCFWQLIGFHLIKICWVLGC